jgi:hypothetical protein
MGQQHLVELIDLALRRASLEETLRQHVVGGREAGSEVELPLKVPDALAKDRQIISDQSPSQAASGWDAASAKSRQKRLGRKYQTLGSRVTPSFQNTKFCVMALHQRERLPQSL